MPFFRELKLKNILILNAVCGLLTGWFFWQGCRLTLGWCTMGGHKMTGFFYRLLGVQLAFLMFIIVYSVNSRYWKRNRNKRPPEKTSFADVAKLCLTVLVYGVGAVLVNLLRLL